MLSEGGDQIINKGETDADNLAAVGIDVGIGETLSGLVDRILRQGDR